MDVAGAMIAAGDYELKRGLYTVKEGSQRRLGPPFAFMGDTRRLSLLGGVYAASKWCVDDPRISGREGS